MDAVSTTLERSQTNDLKADFSTLALNVSISMAKSDAGAMSALEAEATRLDTVHGWRTNKKSVNSISASGHAKDDQGVPSATGTDSSDTRIECQIGIKGAEATMNAMRTRQDYTRRKGKMRQVKAFDIGKCVLRCKQKHNKHLEEAAIEVCLAHNLELEEKGSDKVPWKKIGLDEALQTVRQNDSQHQDSSDTLPFILAKLHVSDTARVAGLKYKKGDDQDFLDRRRTRKMDSQDRRHIRRMVLPGNREICQRIPDPDMAVPQPRKTLYLDLFDGGEANVGKFVQPLLDIRGSTTIVDVIGIDVKGIPSEDLKDKKVREDLLERVEKCGNVVIMMAMPCSQTNQIFVLNEKKALGSGNPIRLDYSVHERTADLIVCIADTVQKRGARL